MIRTACLILALATVSFAQETDPIESEANRIESELIANCCWRSPVSEHYSPAADQIRAEVRQMLTQGMTRDQILDSYVEKYGEQILSAPPKSGIHLLSYLIPALVLVLGGFVVGTFLRRHKTPVDPAQPAGPAEPASDKYSKLLARELAED